MVDTIPTPEAKNHGIIVKGSRTTDKGVTTSVTLSDNQGNKFVLPKDGIPSITCANEVQSINPIKGLSYKAAYDQFVPSVTSANSSFSDIFSAKEEDSKAVADIKSLARDVAGNVMLNFKNVTIELQDGFDSPLTDACNTMKKKGLLVQ